MRERNHSVWHCVVTSLFDSSNIELMMFHCLPLLQINTASIHSNTDGIAEGSTNLQECKWKTDMS